jgi:hypothetical protein
MQPGCRRRPQRSSRKHWHNAKSIHGDRTSRCLVRAAPGPDGVDGRFLRRGRVQTSSSGTLRMPIRLLCLVGYPRAHTPTHPPSRGAGEEISRGRRLWHFDRFSGSIAAAGFARGSSIAGAGGNIYSIRPSPESRGRRPKRKSPTGPTSAWSASYGARFTDRRKGLNETPPTGEGG